MEAINCKDMGDAVKKLFKVLCKIIIKRNFRNHSLKSYWVRDSLVLKIWWNL
jgi:hypothetical protein